MFNFKPPYENEGLDDAIKLVLDEIKAEDPDTDRYAAMVDQLEKLYKLKDLDRPTRVDPNTVIAAAGSVAGIAIIVGFERANIVTSKALNFVMKAR